MRNQNSTRRNVRRRKLIWWGVAIPGFVWAAAAFAYFAYEYSTAPPVAGLEHCYCFSRETWGRILFPSMLFFGIGVVMMVFGLVMASRVGRESVVEQVE